MANVETVLNEVEKARKIEVSKGNTAFSDFTLAKLGSPVMVHTPAGEPDYWFVPLMIENLVCGFAHVNLSGKVIRLGILGGVPNDRNSWIPAEFFSAPPQKIINEIKANYAHAEILDIIFSYDSTPVKWAWAVRLGGKNSQEKIIFVTPSGWYEKRQGDRQSDREG